MTHADCFHHAVGRGSGNGECESSILNAVPLNNFICHLPIHGQLRTRENTAIFLQKTMRFLLSRQFIFDEKDKDFIMKYKEYYEI